MTVFYPGDRVVGYPTRTIVRRASYMKQGAVITTGRLAGQDVVYVAWDGSVAPLDARDRRWRDTLVVGAVGLVAS